MKAVKLAVLLAAFAAFTGRASDTADIGPHILKEGRMPPGVVSDPYEWTLIQFADGPIAGAGVSAYGQIIVEQALREAFADLDGDGERELFLRRDAPGRTWQALVFRRDVGGFRYLGSFGAARLTVVHPDRRALVVFEPSGGHFGYLRTYEYRNGRLELTSSEELLAGDGAPDANNEGIDQLFPVEVLLTWEKVVQPVRSRNAD